MDVKAEVVLLIFTLNCVTLVLVGSDLIKSRLCQDRSHDDKVCSESRATITTNRIIFNNINTTTTTPHLNNISSLIPQFTSSPPPQHQRHHHLFFSPLLSKRLDGSQVLSSPPPLSPSHAPNSVHRSLTSTCNEDIADDRDEFMKEVKSRVLVIIATFVITSVASSQVLGRWIDRWSRRKIMLLPLVGVVVWATCGVLVSAAPWVPLNLWLVGAALCGLSGGFITLKASVTTYAVQATPRGDNTVRLAVLQAVMSVGVLAAYLSFYFLPTKTQEDISNIFLGITVMGVLNVFFTIVFLSNESGPAVTSTTSPNASCTHLSPDEGTSTQVIAHISSSPLNRHAPKEEEEERHVGDHDGEGIAEASKEKADKQDENEEKGEESICDEHEDKGEESICDEHEDKEEESKCDEKKEKEDKENVLNVHNLKEAESNISQPIFPIDIFVTPPEEEEHGNIERKNVMEAEEINQADGYMTAYYSEEEKSREEEFKHIRQATDGSSRHHHTIAVAFEDGNSVYGTPPEQPSRYGTPPSRPLSTHSLETVVATESGHQQSTSVCHHPPQVCFPCYYHCEGEDTHVLYRRPRHHSTGLSSSVPSTFPSVVNARSHEAPYILLNEAQSEYRLGSRSQDDPLRTLNMLLTPHSSLGFTSSCEGSCTISSSSSEGCQLCQDVLREEGCSLCSYVYLEDIQSLSPPVSCYNDTVSLSNDTSTIIRQPENLLTVQNESMGEVGEGAGGRSLTPLTLASESSGEGVCCAGGARRCRVCVAGGLFCRPVSVTFRRRAAGLRGVVVADVVAAFLINLVAAAVWEVTPLYLEAKMKWSLADWIPYLACRSGLGVVALVVVLPLLRRWWLLQDTTLGVLGGLSSLFSSVFLSSLSASSSIIPFALICGPLTQYLNVASASILVRVVAVDELGGVLMCLGTVEQLGQMTGWLTFRYLFPLLLRCEMPGVSFISTGLLVIVPLTILGVLYFSLGQQRRFLHSTGIPSPAPPSL